MTDANRTQISHVREVTLGTTPNTPRMRKARVTGENIRYAPVFVNSMELRSDRMNADPINVNITNEGAINGELSFPHTLSPFSDWLESLFYNAWDDMPARDNDGTADSVITGIATSGTVATVTTGATFAVGHLVRFTGFGVAGNNGVFRVTTASATVPAFVGSGITDEAAPLAAARMKVVGFAGVAADITATASGLGSTLLDFTTLGLNVGGWIKIGGTATGDKFSTAALNDWVRITAIAATALTCDNLPSGWTTDAGTGKTIKVWHGDQLKNGTTQYGQTIERGFLAQVTPNYLISRGMVAGQGTFNFVTEQIATWSITFSGLTGEATTTTLDASPDSETTNAIMAAAVNVGRIAENGVIIANKNYIQSCNFTINNNHRNQGGIRSDSLVGPEGIGVGSADVSVAMETYFGSNAMLTKLFANTATNINVRIAKASQAMVWAIPRITFTDGSPNATAKNTDVMLSLASSASKDTTTSAHIILDRLEYFEA